MRKKDILFGLLIAVIIGLFSFLASISPDGLERVAKDNGFVGKAGAFLNAPFKDYLIPWIHNEKISGSFAGILGVVIVFILGQAIAKLLKRDK